MKDTAHYGRWWLVNAGATCIAVFLYFTLQFATWEYLGFGIYQGVIFGVVPAGLVMALGSLPFLITKAMLKKRNISKTKTRAYILGPALIFVATALILTLWQATDQQRWKQLVGSQPPPARDIHVVGCSGFLAGQWVAIARMNSEDFAKLVQIKDLKPIESVDLQRRFSRGVLSSNGLVRSLSTWTNGSFRSFERISTGTEGRAQGSFFAAYDPARSVAVISRSFHD